ADSAQTGADNGYLFSVSLRHDMMLS
ncbi:MAG: hypothetical protein JWQ10_1235, partial [Herbaspirillum sp.]|nr:hypothetical protein [Herbaspirillum sp.]